MKTSLSMSVMQGGLASMFLKLSTFNPASLEANQVDEPLLSHVSYGKYSSYGIATSHGSPAA